MRKILLIAAACFLGTASLFALAQNAALRPDQFITLPWDWSAGQAVTPSAGGSVSGTVTPNAQAANDFSYVLTGNLTIANPSNLSAGETLNFDLQQDSTGGRTLSLGSDFVAPGGTATLVLSTAAFAEDFLSCRSITTGKIVCTLLNNIVH